MYAIIGPDADANGNHEYEIMIILCEIWKAFSDE